MSRADKRVQALHHDSRRWLKYHRPRRSDPTVGLQPRENWIGWARFVVKMYPEWYKEREIKMRGGGLLPGRRGPSAEFVVMRYSTGPVAAVDMALGQFPKEKQDRLRAILWEGAQRHKNDGMLVNHFYRCLAAYLGYGRPFYDCQSAKNPKDRLLRLGRYHHR